MSPKFSILTPVHNPPEAVLAAMLASVQRQTNASWEHCIVDDGSSVPHVRKMLEAAAAEDPRVKVAFRPESGGIVAATNDALALASGEFIALLDHDDELHAEALTRVAEAIDAHDDVDYVYTDEDKIGDDGRHFGTFLKPDWSPERMRAQMYTCHLSVARRELVVELGGYRDGLDGSQDWDLVLRVTERARRIVHVREVCYHWRAIASSTAASADAKPWAYDAARRVIADHIERVGFPARVEGPTEYGAWRILPALRSEPSVSIVIPTAGQVRTLYGEATCLVTNCVRSIVERSSYGNYEIVAVIDTHAPGDLVDRLRAIAGDRLRVVWYASPFNFSEKINLGVLESEGEHVLLLNDDVEVLPAGWRDRWPDRAGTSEWLESMVMYSAWPGVGAVGARLYFADLRIQHAGVVMHDGRPSHAYRGFPSKYGGYAANATIPCNYLMVTGACLMSPRAAFEAVGGLSLEFPVNFNDVDYGLKLHHAGYRTVYDPEVELLHYESSTRDSGVFEHELRLLEHRWRSLMNDDPYYHPRLDQTTPDFWPPPIDADGEFLIRS